MLNEVGETLAAVLSDALHTLRSGEILRERMPHAPLTVASSPTQGQEHPDALTDVIGSFVQGGAVRAHRRG